MSDDPAPEIFELLNKEISDLLGSGPFFIMPICIKGQAIGVIYATVTRAAANSTRKASRSSPFWPRANNSLTTLAGIQDGGESLSARRQG